MRVHAATAGFGPDTTYRLAVWPGGTGFRVVERALSVAADSLVCVAVTGTEGAAMEVAWMDHAAASAETPAGCV